MHAIIMGAGEGTRMWPLSSLVNKHLLKLGGKPVIRHIVDKLLRAENGLVYYMKPYDITIVCLEKDEKDYRWEFRDLNNINFHVLKENKGTANEFYDATRNAGEDVLLHYGDTITDLDYKELIKFWYKGKENKVANALIAITKNIKHDYSAVWQLPSGQVEKIVEKPQLDMPSWTGIGIFNNKYFANVYYRLPQYYNGDDSDFGFDILPEMAKDGKLHAYQYDGKWFDVGNLRSYQKLAKEYQNKDLKL